jgi:hypothetical protein
MADRTSTGGAAGVDRPELTLLNLFPTPLVIATMPEAETLNAELKRIILAREAASASMQRSNQGGWQSSWDMHQWGGAPMRQVLAFGRAIAEEITVDRTGKRHELVWQVNSWPMSTGTATATNSTLIPARFGPRRTTSTTAV